jgi:hypothetical protein
VPDEVTRGILQSTSAPLIGIGAGTECHGQVLVIQDLLGMTDEPPRFAEPGFFLPLAIAMAPFGAVLFTVGVRPAFDDGSVRDWVQFLCRENNLDVVGGQDTTLAGFAGCMVDAYQPSDMGRMKIRTFFFEDGQRLFQLGIIAPEQIWPSVEAQLSLIQRSFRTEVTQGQTAPIAPPPEPTPAKPDPVVTEYAEPALPPEPEPAPAEPTTWRTEVDRLEQAGQIEAAEALLMKSIDHLGVFSSAAYLWEREAARRAAARDMAGAKAAARRAADLLDQYAASATSGGEGTALSRERNERVK